jgi:hypothetical protein
VILLSERKPEYLRQLTGMLEGTQMAGATRRTGGVESPFPYMNLAGLRKADTKGRWSLAIGLWEVLGHPYLTMQ